MPPPAKPFPDALIFANAGMRGDSRVFRLTQSFRYRSSLGMVCVPRGFETDGASIPRAFWSLLAPFGPYFEAAVIHDFLYSPYNDEYSREESDMIFEDAMEDLGVRWLTRTTIYHAVRLFGRPRFKATVLS